MLREISKEEAEKKGKDACILVTDHPEQFCKVEKTVDDKYNDNDDDFVNIDVDDESLERAMFV